MILKKIWYNERQNKFANKWSWKEFTQFLFGFHRKLNKPRVKYNLNVY